MAFYYDRRTFLKNSATWAAAIPAGKVLGAGVIGHGGGPQGGSLSAALESGFLNPPDDAWPWVFWFASDGNITREGITADLEAMHRVGIRGVLYMEVDQNVPKGPARFLSPEWRELIQHAMKEATRLGMAIDMNNDGGWCGSGGPWIPPELSMQMLVWSEVPAEGGREFSAALPQPKVVRDFYRDICVLAFPTPTSEHVSMASRSPKISHGLDRKSFDADNLMNGNLASVSYVPLPPKGETQYINIDFPEPFKAQALSFGIDRWGTQVQGELQVSEDGKNYQTVRETTFRWPTTSINFPEKISRHFRVVLKDPASSWGDPMPHGFPVGELKLHAGPRVEDIPAKAAYGRLEYSEYMVAEPADSAGSTVRRDQLVDLSGKMDSSGHLKWQVPEGKWTIVRFGHTSTGKLNHPAPEESLGLECDKLSKKALDVHFDGLMGVLLKDQAEVGSNALQITHIDSWETGAQNWTPGFREEFKKRRGYDPVPFLPLLTGRIVDSPSLSERFLWDLRRTVADMLLENYADHMRELAYKNGLKLSIEAYGWGPLDEVAFGGRADIPMGEFWMGNEGLNGLWADIPLTWTKEMASSGHVYGKPIIGAEAFTSITRFAKWQNHPYEMKPVGDWAFTQGINRFIFHRYSMQPWMNRAPGMTMGPWGVNYERTNTWWEKSGAWHTYLARCQYLLQKGRFAADIAVLGGENGPNSFPTQASQNPHVPEGFDYDQLPPEMLMKADFRDGRLALPSGMTYRILVLPPARTITPELLGKIRELVLKGLTVVGPRPQASPSLRNYPRCDEEVARLAEELWGATDGAEVFESRVGEGRVILNKPLIDVFKGMSLPPDLSSTGVTIGNQLRFIHRTMDGEDVYFVASSLPEARRFQCQFRVQGKRPELWWPDSGKIEPVEVFEERDGITRVSLALGPCGSVFVVFRSDAGTGDSIVSVRRDGMEISGIPETPVAHYQLSHCCGTVRRDGTQYSLDTTQSGVYELRLKNGRVLKAEVPFLPEPLEIRGPWDLSFPKGWGAPDQVSLDRLISWTEHSNSGVKYFSGTATYRTTFQVPKSMLAPGRRVHLDLGRVAVIAQMKVNGKDAGVFWKPPFSADVTNLFREGNNELAVEVVNLWPNRLIGDDFLPNDSEWNEKTWIRGGGVLARYPKWLLEGKPSPTGRFTFAPWKLWTKDDALLVSGLLGPVTLRATYHVEFGP